MRHAFVLALFAGLAGAGACIPDIVPTPSGSTGSMGSAGGDPSGGGGTMTGGGAGGGSAPGGGGPGGTGGGGGEGGGVPGCGDGVIVPPEVCDDRNHVAGDGCSSDCRKKEKGFVCGEAGEDCTPICGDGLVRGDEACDDTNTEDGDGCAGDCMAIELGWECLVEGADCTEICGDGLNVGDEVCDDHNDKPNDGCNATCRAVEEGFTCPDAGACDPICGDGLKVGSEACDDHNTGNGDGCKSNCKQIEAGWACDVPGDDCTEICGDGLIVGDEACDDHNDESGDGCPGDCRAVPLCGNGVIDGAEQCDDGNTDSGDGCPTDCTGEEEGWTCPTPGSPCTPICGDGLKKGTEPCDDGNGIDNDACTNACTRGSIDLGGDAHTRINGALTLLGETFSDQGISPHPNGGAGVIIMANFSNFDDCSGGCPDYKTKLNAGVHVLLIGGSNGAEAADWLDGYLKLDTSSSPDWHSAINCTTDWIKEGTHPITKYMPDTWEFLNQNVNGPSTHPIHFTFTQPSGAEMIGTTCHNGGAPGILATRRYSTNKGTFTNLALVVGSEGDAQSLNNFLLPFLKGYLEYIRSPVP